jgi:O-antigen/teichoic acid export membrane protein
LKSATQKRIVQGFAARGVGQAVTILIRLVEIPLMFHFWGINLYGEWLVLTAIPAYLSMSDFGFGSVTARHMAMLVAAGKRDEALGSFQSSHLLITISSVAVAALLILGAWIVDAGGFFSFARIASHDILIIMALFGFKMILGLQMQLGFGGLQCEGKYPLGLLLLAITDLVEFVCLALAVGLGATPVGAASAACAGVAVCALAFLVVLRRAVPWIRLGWGKASLAHIKELWRPSLSAMGFPLGQALSFQGPRLILGALASPALVATFVAHRQLVRFGTLLLALGAPVQAELAMTLGRGNEEEYRRDALRAAQLMIYLSLAAILFAISIGAVLFGRWTSGRLEVDFSLLLLLACATFFETTWRAILLPVSAINQHMRAALAYMFVSVVILVPALYVLGRSWGLAGAAVALIGAEVVMFALTANESMRLLAVGPLTWFYRTFQPPLWIVGEGRDLLAGLRKTESGEPGDGS